MLKVIKCLCGYVIKGNGGLTSFAENLQVCLGDRQIWIPAFAGMTCGNEAPGVRAWLKRYYVGINTGAGARF